MKINKKMKHLKYFKEDNDSINYVLDKINRDGIENLTKLDKEVLDNKYNNPNIDWEDFKNNIFLKLCEFETKQNILSDIEDEYNIHPYYFTYIYEYCKEVYNRIAEVFNELVNTPSIYDFFETYVSYNNTQSSNTVSFFNNNVNSWIIVKAFKESFEDVGIYFDDNEYDNISTKIVNCFNI